MIAGLGSDICRIERIAESWKRFGSRFVCRCCGEGEREELPPAEDEQKYAASLAKRFAAKEAFSKALGTGFRNGLALADIEVLHRGNGQPYIRLRGRAAELAAEKGIKKIWLSLSDDHPFAQAVVVIEA